MAAGDDPRLPPPPPAGPANKPEVSRLRQLAEWLGIDDEVDAASDATSRLGAWIRSLQPESHATPEERARVEEFMRRLDEEKAAQQASRDAIWNAVADPVKRFFGSPLVQGVGHQLHEDYKGLWEQTPETQTLARLGHEALNERNAPVHEAMTQAGIPEALQGILNLPNEGIPNFLIDQAAQASTPAGMAMNLDVPIGPALKAAGLLKGGAAAAHLAGMLPPGEEMLSGVARARRTLASRWPQLEAALTKHGADVTLPGAKRSYANALDRLAADIHARTLAEGGSSTYPLTGVAERAGQSEGFTVGRYSNDSGKTKAIPISQFTPDDIRAFIEEHADELARSPTGDASPSLVGTWHDKPTGTVFLDVSQKYPTARGATMAGAIQKQPKGLVRDPVTGKWPEAQKMIFDLENAQDLPVGNLAEFVGSPEFRQRLDEMYEAGVPVMEGKNWWDLHGTSLEDVYGPERLRSVAGYLASTSNAAPPVHNMRAASEYIRRWIKGEPIIQPEFRIPETSVGWREGAMGGQQPGDFNRPGTMMPFERPRTPNLLRVYEGTPEQIRKDKMNDMFHALLGEQRAVIDRRYAKLAEKPSEGVYVSGTPDKVPGGMGTTQVSAYALIENAVRSAAEARGMDLDHYSAYVWEGIGNTIKQTGELYGVKHRASAIPEASQGFAGIFDRMIEEKAGYWGITVDEFKRRLRAGDAELLMALLSTPVGLAAYSQWAQGDQPRSSASPPRPPY